MSRNNKININIKKYSLFTFFILIIVLITTTNIYPKFNKTNHAIEPSICLTGPLDNIKDDKFIIIPNIETYNFHEHIIQALNKVRTYGEDFGLEGISYTGGGLAEEPKLYFSSKTQNKSKIMIGETILDQPSYAYSPHSKFIKDEQIKHLINPLKALQIAKPILNCYQDYPNVTRRNIRLAIEDDKVLWIVSIEDIHISIPGPNVRHSVTINAFNGEILNVY